MTGRSKKTENEFHDIRRPREADRGECRYVYYISIGVVVEAALRLRFGRTCSATDCDFDSILALRGAGGVRGGLRGDVRPVDAGALSGDKNQTNGVGGISGNIDVSGVPDVGSDNTGNGATAPVDHGREHRRLVQRAIELFTEVIDAYRCSPDEGASVVTASQRLACYCNRSAAYAKLGEWTAAVRDADVVIETGLEVDRRYVLKAYHRKAQALWSLGEKVEAVKAYKSAVSLRVDDPGELTGEMEVIVQGIQASAVLMVSEMPYGWLAAYYVKLLATCEATHPWSRRDGLLLKRVPDSVKLDAEAVRSEFVEGLDEDVTFRRACQKGVVDLWSGLQGMKSLCAYVRGYVYYQASRKVGEGEGSSEGSSEGRRDGLLRQGEMDATVALVYRENDGMVPYPEAHALRGLCYEARGENVLAVLDVLQAIEGELAAGVTWGDEEEEEGEGGGGGGRNEEEGVERDEVRAGVNSKIFEQTLSRLLPRIPEHYAAAINEGCGFAGLHKMMEVERERMQPEFMKKRPKYYYYYEWMKKRIRDRHPEVADGVMDKLLALDAGELDLLLQYPQAIDATVQRLEGVLEERGEGGLEQYEVPLLSWGDVQKLKDASEHDTAGTLEVGSETAALKGAA